MEHFRVWQHLRDFQTECFTNGQPLLADGLSFDPFVSGKDAVFLARQRGGETGTTKTIPTQTALFAINAAIEWVVCHSDELIKLREAERTETSKIFRRLKANKRANQHSIERQIAERVQAWIVDPTLAPVRAGKLIRTKLSESMGVSFSALYRTEAHKTLLEAFDDFLRSRDQALAQQLAERCAKILETPIPETDGTDLARCRREAKETLLPYSGSVHSNGGPWPIVDFGASPKHERSLEAALICLWSACFLIIGAFMADRLEEILLIEDDCLVHRDDGPYLHNRTWKESGTEAGEDGYRPCPEIVVRAVDVLLKMKSGRTTSAELFAVPHRGGDALPDETTARKRLEAFCEWIGLRADESDDPWFIRPHQLRRFFVITCVWFYEAGPDLLALKTFLRQNDLETCARYAKSATQGEILSQRKGLFGLVLERAAFKDLDIKGAFGNYLKRFLRRLRVTVGDPARISREIDQLQQKTDLTLRPSAWGYCAWTSGRSRYARCAAAAGIENPTGPVE